MEERGLRLLLTGSRACQLRRGGVNLLGGRTRTTYDAVRSRIEGGRCSPFESEFQAPERERFTILRE